MLKLVDALTHLRVGAVAGLRNVDCLVGQSCLPRGLPVSAGLVLLGHLMLVHHVQLALKVAQLVLQCLDSRLFLGEALLESGLSLLKIAQQGLLVFAKLPDYTR